MIVPIVEGHAEVQSVRVLLDHILHEKGVFTVGVSRPFRVKRYRVVREGELERAIRFATVSRQAAAAVLILLDSDDDCPAQLGPQLLARSRRATALPTSVVFACREFEAWFLGAKESLRGVRGIRDDASSPADPEAIRGAKERLSANMAGRRYIEVDDQPALAKKIDLAQAQASCPSFTRFVREVYRLADSITGSTEA